MTPLQQKQLQLLKETAAFYNSNNRCFNPVTKECKYFWEGKAGCAIGRLIQNKELCKELDKGIEVELAPDTKTSVSYDEIFKKLPAEIQEYEKDFLYKLQQFHDTPENWDENGLNTNGQKHFNRIVEEFNLGELIKVNKKVKLNLIGVDGNAYAIMGVFQRQAKREGWTQDEIKAVLDEAMSGDYSHLLATIMDHCDMSEADEDEE